MLLVFLFIWGTAVVADSPLFSTLVAQNAPAHIKGSALTIVTCIGFTITIASIQLLSWLSGIIDTRFLYLALAIGPAAGLAAMFVQNKKDH
jgi:MFS family permease